MPHPFAIVADAGPGLGHALVKNPGARGYDAFGLNRSAPSGADDRILSCDLTDPLQVSRCVTDLIRTHDAPAIVIHNPTKLVIAPFTETSADDFKAIWRTMVLSAVYLSHAVLPGMVESKGGAFVISGSTVSLRGGRNFAAFASARAGLRAVAQFLAREYMPKGIYVARVILDGIPNNRASRSLRALDPVRTTQTKDVAATCLRLARQPKSAWIHELDLRPMGEAF
jgi:NAD(P)-dependent dehydrogenase (short-subunit alcohol dehydrogenase family)